MTVKWIVVNNQQVNMMFNELMVNENLGKDDLENFLCVILQLYTCSFDVNHFVLKKENKGPIMLTITSPQLKHTNLTDVVSVKASFPKIQLV